MTGTRFVSREPGGIEVSSVRENKLEGQQERRGKESSVGNGEYNQYRWWAPERNSLSTRTPLSWRLTSYQEILTATLRGNQSPV